MIYTHVATKNTLRLKDISLHPRSSGLPKGHLPLRGLLGAPLIDSQGNAFGLIMLSDKKDNIDFDEEDEMFIKTFSTQTSLVIENVKLLNDVKEKISQLEHLSDSSGLITSSLEIKEVLINIISIIKKLCMADYVSVILIKDNGDFSISYDDFPGVPPIEKRIRPKGLTRKIVNTGEPVMIDDVKYYRDVNPILIEANIRSFSGIPLKSKDKVIGVLNVYSKKQSAFLKYSDILITFANHATIAIENAKLFEDLKETLENLKLAQEEIIKTKKLEAIVELARTTAHEINNPLSIIYGYAELLLKKKEIDSNDYKALKRIYETSERIAGIVRNLSNITKYETKEYINNKIIDFDKSSKKK